MYIQKGIKFLLHKRGKGDSEHLSIRMRVTLKGQPPFDFPTGHNINLVDWDMGNQRALASCEAASTINRTIDEWKSVMNEIFARYELIEKRIPTPGEVKDLFNDMVGRKTKTNESLTSPGDNFFTTFNLFTETMGKQNGWTDATQEKFRAIKAHLQSFDPSLSFYNLNEEKMQAYLSHLSKVGLRNTTIAKNLAFVRWFLRWAANKGYYLGNLHDTFKPKLKGIDGNSKEIIYFTQDEIKTLENYQFFPHNQHLNVSGTYSCFRALLGCVIPMLPN